MLSPLEMGTYIRSDCLNCIGSHLHPGGEGVPGLNLETAYAAVMYGFWIVGTASRQVILEAGE